MNADDAGGIASIVSPDTAARDLRIGVKAFCAANPGWTIKRVGEMSGVGEERLRKLLENDEGERRPCKLSEALSIWAVIGTRGATASLAAIGMLAEPEESAPECIARTAAQLAMAGGELAMLSVDGIDASEADQADAAADRAIASAVALKGAAAQARRGRRR